MSPKLKNWLVFAHRWLAIALAPVFILILLSGAILAFKPIVEDAPGPQATVAASSLLATLNAADPSGNARMVRLAPDGRSLELAVPGPSGSGSYDLATHARIDTQAPPAFDLFAFAKDLHKNLLVGADDFVEIAAYAMLAIIVAGLLLGWPKLRNTLIGWHQGAGWLALPLVLLTPLTAVLMILHVGDSRMPRIEQGAPITLARAIEAAAPQADLSGFSSARRFRAGSVLLETRDGTATHRYLVSPGGRLVPIQGPGLVHQLHEGTWAGATSGLINLASALILSGLLGTGVYAWWRRRRQSAQRSADEGASILVAFASQTGTAASLAEATAAALRRAGQRVTCASLGAIAPRELAGFRQTLLIASTTGEGQVPDPAQPFLQQLQTADLHGARFSLLALGDSRYHAFCGGGATLRQALLERGASESLDWQRADGNPGKRWLAWLGAVGRLLGVALEMPAVPAPERELRLRLERRERLDDASDPELNETWSLLFELEDDDTDFRPGDLLLVSPAEGEPERCYSIGTTSRLGSRQVGLTVSAHRWLDADGQEHRGRTSDFLCHVLQEGDTLKARLRRHPGFNPPTDIQRPIIMVAAGAGIAPFPGFLAERDAHPDAGPAWLLFGNRKRNGDFFYRSLFETALQDGKLARLDTAFSRDADDGRYIQERLAEHGAEILDWLATRGGVLYTCGKASTVGRSVETALREALARHGAKYGLETEATLSRWKADGTLRIDVFG